MRTLILFFAFAQQPGTVTVTNTVTAVAGAITCTWQVAANGVAKAGGF